MCDNCKQPADQVDGKSPQSTHHLIVVCSVTWPMDDSEGHNCKIIYFMFSSVSITPVSAFVFYFFCGTGSSSFEALDITNYCLDLLKILHQAASLSERVTAIKLVDAWCGKGQTSLRMRDVNPPDLSREDCERVVVYLLLEGVLREDFHFTPYSTISYILAGPNAKLVRKPGKQVFMDFRVDSRFKKVGRI